MTDRSGLTSIVAPPLEAPAYVRFQDIKTGEWIEGRSEPKIDPNHFRIYLDVRAYAPCRFVAHRGRTCGCKKKLVGHRYGPANLCTNVFANLVQAAIMGQTTSITDTGGSGRSVTKTVDGGVATRTGAAGTGGTAATVADTALQTETETTSSVTINAVSGSGSSGTFTVTYTVTAGADRIYQEVGLRMTTTSSGWVFCITHDTFTALNVSNTGTLAVTYTFTNS